MKAPFYIDTTAADPTVVIGLPWEADSLAVINPTKYTVAVRVGSRSRPTTGNADLVYAPTSALELPVSAREFFLVATTPILPIVPDDMPTRITILATKGEPRASFGGIPLAGQSPPALVLLRSQGDRAAGVYADSVAVPTGITTLVLREFGMSLSALSVVGNTSGRTYFELNAPTSGSYLNGTDGWAGSPKGSTAVIRFDRDLDASVTVNATVISLAQSGYTLYGYAERLPAGTYHSDGRLMVDPFKPGQTYLQVASIPGAFPVQVAQFWPALPTPTVQVRGIVGAPAINTLICTTGALAAGDYCIEAEMGSTDLPAAVARYVYLVLNSAAPVMDFLMPAPGLIRSVWGRVTVAGGQAVEIRSGSVAGVAGSFYQGAIRAYKLA